MKNKILISIAFLMILLAVRCDAADKDQCVECHLTLDGSAKEPAVKIQNDIHFKRGLSCADCHGGDRTKEDMAEAMDPAKGYVGKPPRNDIPKFCSKCHSDPAFMRRYNPNIQTDQYAQYLESQHGKLNAQGDQKVAICVSCHDVHGIRAVNDPSSPVYITNIPKRCSSCHSNKEYMKDYPIPTDQMEKYEHSVHGIALLKKGDRGAPACSSCHSAHGAALPGAAAVGNVCAQCHSLTRDLFAKSPHKAAHDSLGIPECEACHGNHDIVRTSDAMLGTGSGAVCVKCHKDGSKPYAVAIEMKNSIETLKNDTKESSEVIDNAEKLGLDVSDTKFYLDEAENALTKSRTYVHTFSSEEVAHITKEGVTSAVKAADQGKKAINEFNFKRLWILVVLCIILLLAVALYLKIRFMEKAQ